MPVILDGAQGAGAVPVDVKALGCVAYAAAGQKWLCGADGTGLLYAATRSSASACARSRPATWPSRTPRAGWNRPSAPAAGASTRRSPREAVAFSLAAYQMLVAAGFDDADRARRRPRRHASPPRWPRRGHTVAPRGRSTLVAFEYPEPAEARQRLAEAGVAVRDLPGHPYLRASVGAWNDESDLERLLAALRERGLRLLRLELRLGPGLPGGHAGPRADARGRGSASSTAAPRSA